MEDLEVTPELIDYDRYNFISYIGKKKNLQLCKVALKLSHIFNQYEDATNLRVKKEMNYNVKG